MKRRISIAEWVIIALVFGVILAAAFIGPFKPIDLSYKVKIQWKP